MGRTPDRGPRWSPRWAGLAGYTLTAGIAALAAFLAAGAFIMPDHEPLHPWAGLVQRALILGPLFPCA